MMEFHRSEFIVESSRELKAFISKLLDGGEVGETKGYSPVTSKQAPSALRGGPLSRSHVFFHTRR